MKILMSLAQRVGEAKPDTNTEEQVQVLLKRIDVLQGEHLEYVQAMEKQHQDREQKLNSLRESLEDQQRFRLRFGQLQCRLSALESGEEVARLRAEVSQLRPQLERVQNQYRRAVAEKRRWRQRCLLFEREFGLVLECH